MQINADLDESGEPNKGATKEALLKAIVNLDQEFAKWIRLWKEEEQK